jgi:hypothetical protein
MATFQFTPRLTAPKASDKNWLHTSKGGLNRCILISGSSCLPNCVGYAWGRWRELLAATPKLSTSNAENWYINTADGYKRGATPKPGAVICWRKGAAGVARDGAGHVAVVEKIDADGKITVSQSGYNSNRFWTSVLKKPYAMSGYAFQGFIYLPEAAALLPAPAPKPAAASAKATAAKPAAPALKTGAELKLTAVPLFTSSATAKASVGTRTGKYWVWSGDVVNGRVRVTNSVSRVGKTPAGTYVTGWVEVGRVTQ